MANDKKVWFITGISRGIGQCLAQAVLAKGDVVIGTTRDGKSAIAASANLHVLSLDVSNHTQVKTVLAQAHAIANRLDVIVNNAGFGLLGAVEECATDEIEKVFKVNFFGALAVVQAALPYLRQARKGHIVNISSIAGLTAGRGSGLYAASKFALEGMSQSLAQEVAPLGIKVTVVEPGAFRTDFLSEQSILHAKASITDYAETSGKMIGILNSKSGSQLGDPEVGSQIIIEAVESENPPLNLLLGSDAVQRFRAKLEQYNRDLSTWEARSLSTDFKEPAVKA